MIKKPGVDYHNINACLEVFITLVIINFSARIRRWKGGRKWGANLDQSAHSYRLVMKVYSDRHGTSTIDDIDGLQSVGVRAKIVSISLTPSYQYVISRSSCRLEFLAGHTSWSHE